MNIAPILLFFQLGACLCIKFCDIEGVVGCKFERKKAHKNAVSFRQLLGLVFVCIMYRNEYSVVGMEVIFKTSMNI